MPYICRMDLGLVFGPNPLNLLKRLASRTDSDSCYRRERGELGLMAGSKHLRAASGRALTAVSSGSVRCYRDNPATSLIARRWGRRPVYPGGSGLSYPGGVGNIPAVVGARNPLAAVAVAGAVQRYSLTKSRPTQ